MSRELLDKYLAGQCTTNETHNVEVWYEAQKGDKDFLHSLSDLDKQLLEEETLQRIRTTIGVPLKNEVEIPKKMSLWRNWGVQMGIAASILLVFGVGLALYQSKTSKPADELFGQIEPIMQAENSIIRFVNKEAKLITHRLPDGTQVSLYPSAELTYPKTFAGKTRRVTFIGEGFFDVAHDSLHPFLIQSDKMQIRVLGTKFNVRALPKQAIFQVSVLSGSVAVRGLTEDSDTSSETIILKPQQKALFEVATNQLTAIETNIEAKKEIFEPISINFNDTPLSEVINQLEKQFNIHLQLSDKAIAKCQLTADFNNQSLPVILEILCTTLNVTYSLSGDTLILKGVGCE